VYISGIRIVNIRGFHGARNVNVGLVRPDGSHAGWTVIAGRNGSGKTTLLRAIALAVSGPAVARSLIPDFQTWLSADERVADADVLLSTDTDLDRMSGSGRRPKDNWVGLQWAAGRSTGPASTTRQVQPTLTELSDDKPTQFARRGPWQDNPTGWFCAAYGPFRRLVGGSADAQRLMLGRGPVARLVSLFHEDASLAEGVGWLIEQHLRSLENRPGAAAVKETAVQVLADGLLPDGYQVARVDSDGLWVVSNGREFPLREMSDGYRTVAALGVDLIKQIYQAYGELSTNLNNGHLAVTAPGVVIIDEVDAHLHVSWQKRIGGWLKTHFPNIQFIVTTHSPYVCQAADEGGLIRLPGPDEHEAPRVVDEDLYRRIVYGSGDDAALSDLFGLDTPYSDRAQQLRRELVQLEGAVLAGKAGGVQRRRYRQLQSLLSSSTVASAYEAAARLGVNDSEEA
jgi:hypothetical protein